MEFKKSRWTIGNVIDLECVFTRDRENSDEQSLRKRDRELFLRKIRPVLLQYQSFELCDDEKIHQEIKKKNIEWEKGEGRREILSIWLSLIKGGRIKNGVTDENRNENQRFYGNGHGESVFPGALYEETLALVRLIMIVAGLFLGFSLCLSFFSYTGRQPLNVSYFLAVTLLPQFILLVMLMGLLASIQFNWIDSRTYVPYPILNRGIERLFLFFNRTVLARISPDRLQRMAATLGIVRQARQVYGFLFFWPLFKLVQLFGAAFNGAIFCFIVFRVFFFDTAFGWQSTLQVGADAVYKIVTVMALPWSWIQPEGFAVPTFDQIVGSRMILKDGIYRLATEDLISWWPFLCMTVVVYGLLPRLLLLGFGQVTLKRALAGLSFDHADCTRLFRRLLTPHVEYYGINRDDGGDVEKSIHPVNLSSDRVEKDTQEFNMSSNRTEKDIYPAEMSSNRMEKDMDQVKIGSNRVEKDLGQMKMNSDYSPSIAFIPEDLQEMMDKERFNALTRILHRFEITSILSMEMDLTEALNEMAHVDNRFADPPGIIMLLEAWQPPIKEILDFIKEMRGQIGQRRALTILLIGKPTPKTIFTPVSQMDWEIWRLKLTALGDPWLAMEEIVDNDAVTTRIITEDGEG